MILVSLLLITAERFAEGIVTWKSVAFRLPSVFKFKPDVLLPVVVGVVTVPFALVVGWTAVLLILFCRVTVALVGGFKPSVRDLSLLTCMTAISIMTSGRALSRSSTSFSASAI